ncbi:Bcr/CflA subfamily drug resistance transporter [Thiomicrospira sp. XS5]|uniref:multidrug effflux MFS transporter n=1 Tax=Thiomicrospira sp. XS5 TaxID=1775636 RepID=UPI0007462ABA|nr:multidrug effflux MFS transporter [Thiomicrospira sp. XS5]KUJ74970.1 Bcr/CflA subfamily drug resistance transporter [Thiomicrospira sp. XS5]
MHALSARQLAPRLGALVALTPFAVDTYLPAIPEMAVFLDSTVNQVSLTVPLFLISFALGQLIGGPLSDRFGRKPIAFIGLLVFAVSSLLIMFSVQIEQLYAMRVLQAIGGGFATVVSAAMVRDLYSGRESAKVFSMIAMVMLIAPMAAPGVGALIVNLGDWHKVFLFLALYAGVLFVVVKWALPETVGPERRRQARSEPVSQLLMNYKQVLSNTRALGFLLAQGFASSILFVYITEAPFIYMDFFGVSSASFPFYFGLVVLGVMFFNRVNIGLLKHYEPEQIVLGALIAQVMMTLLFVSYVVLFEPNVYLVLLIQFFVLGLLGMITPNVQARYMDFFPEVSGTANALVGTSIFAFGGVMGLVMGALHDGSLSRVVLFIFAMSAISLLSLWWVAKVRFSNPATPTEAGV